MKKYIKSSTDQSKEMSYSEREHLAEEIGDIVSRYLDDDHGSVVYSVSYSKYDLLKYTFRVQPRYRSYSSYCQIMEDEYGEWKEDVNSMKKEVRALLRSYGFRKTKFDMKKYTTEEHYAGDWGTVRTKFHYLDAIYFDE